jgi:hypothetical protein
MASAWLDIAVDWENPNGWNIPELLNIIIEAYEERVVLSQNNTTTMALLSSISLNTNNGIAPAIVNNISLNEINEKLETLLLESQNRTTESPADFIPWAIDDFLTEKGLPVGLIPADFTCEIFDYRWITYWFYILNETYFMGSKVESYNSTGGEEKKANNKSSFALALSDFATQTYSPTGGTISGYYQYFFRSSDSAEFHTISQYRNNSYNFNTNDKDNLPYEINTETYFLFFGRSDPPNDLMTWNYSDGDAIDVSASFSWNAINEDFEATDIALPDIVPTTNSNTLPFTGSTLTYYWNTIDSVTFNHEYRFVSDLNDVNLITYTPIV